MERYFDKELTELQKTLLFMAGLVEESISNSIQALEMLDEGLARQVIDEDDRINALELSVDDKCLDLIALHQPMAIDLRFITMAMKISTDLERIADLSVDISQRTLELAGQPQLKPLIDIPRLAGLSQKMVKDAIDAFVRRDTDLAKSVILRDSEADDLRNLIQSELINDFLMKDPLSAPRAVPLLLVGRHLERICDHATNIAESVIYMVKAEVVKHHKDAL